MIAPLLALASLAPPAPQGHDLVELVMGRGETVTYSGDSYLITTFDRAQIGASGGWIAEAILLRNPPSSDIRFGLIGEYPGQVGDGVEMLKVGDAAAGSPRHSIHHPIMWAGQIAYIADDLVSETTVWLDDTRLLGEDDPVGTTGFTWEGFQDLRLTSSGTLLVEGLVRDPAGNFAQVIFDMERDEFLFRLPSVFPGIPGVVSVYIFRDVSPDGNHWAAKVRNPAGVEAMVLDDELIRFAPGFPALVGSPVPPNIRAAIGPQAWSSFGDVRVNDRGDVAFEATAGPWKLLVRNGFAIEASLTETSVIHEMDERGAVVSGNLSREYLRSEQELLVAEDAAIDADGDGVADPTWLISSQPKLPLGVGLQRTTLFYSRVSQPFGTGDGIFLGRPYRIDRPFCDGVPNSTGKIAEMLASGNARVAANDAQFQVIGLPAQSLGYFIVSKTPGFVVQPGGSQGNLCLNGAIGRMSQQVFSSGTAGRASVTLDLTAFPQQSGTVAVVAGETWLSQAWYRDAVAGAPTSNFSSGVATKFE